MDVNNKDLKIDFVYIFHCGYCKNNLKNIFKNGKNEEIIFSSKVVLMHHKKYGYFIYDTGYSKQIYNCGFVGNLYNFFNPTFVEKSDEIPEKLSKIGIPINDIKSLIISHLHPDHIGGLKFFDKSKILVSKDVYLSYKNNKFKNLIFKSLLTDFFERKLSVIDNFKNMYFFKHAFDLFSDSSVILVKLDGHAKGQLGIYLPEHKILFAADCCWKAEFLEKIDKMKFIPKLIQDDFCEYKKTISLLGKLKDKNIKLIFSHDDNVKEGRII